MSLLFPGIYLLHANESILKASMLVLSRYGHRQFKDGYTHATQNVH